MAAPTCGTSANKELVEIRRQASVHAPEFVYLRDLEQGALQLRSPPTFGMLAAMTDGRALTHSTKVATSGQDPRSILVGFVQLDTRTGCVRYRKGIAEQIPAAVGMIV